MQARLEAEAEDRVAVAALPEVTLEFGNKLILDLAAALAWHLHLPRAPGQLQL